MTVDGEPAHLGQKIDPTIARVEIDGIPLPVRPDLVHYLVYKPPGVVSTAHDPQGRPTVVELVPSTTRVYPAGRLDADSEGLIVVTNDGELTELLTHPRHGIEKVYLARIEGVPGRRALRAITAGIDLEDGPARALRVKVVDRSGPEALVEVVMVEGKNREVRRLLAAVGHEVTALVRVAIGPIRDHSLTPGRWRPLTIAEIRALYRAAHSGGER